MIRDLSRFIRSYGDDVMCNYTVWLSISTRVILCLCLHNLAEAQINSSPYELIEVFRVGDEARGDTILFRNHEATEIAVDNIGRFFVGGWRESPVVAFSDEGHFVGYVGAKGKGPGEFNSSNSVTIGPEGKIYVFDGGNMERLSVFESGLFQYSHSISTVSLHNPVDAFKLLGVSENGHFFRYITAYMPPGDPDEYVPGESRFEFVSLVNDQGAVVMESIAKLPATEFWVTTYSDEEGSSINVSPLPFGRTPFFAYKNGMIYAGWNDAIDISVISEDGEIIRTIKREHQAKPVTRKEIEVQISSMSRADRRAIRRSELLPKTKPAYDALIVDDQGHIWIREFPDNDSEFTNWLIIDSDSKLVGQIEMPTNVLLKTIKDGRVYASVYSETYGPYVSVYSLTE